MNRVSGERTAPLTQAGARRGASIRPGASAGNILNLAQIDRRALPREGGDVTHPFQTERALCEA